MSRERHPGGAASEEGFPPRPSTGTGPPGLTGTDLADAFYLAAVLAREHGDAEPPPEEGRNPADPKAGPRAPGDTAAGSGDPEAVEPDEDARDGGLPRDDAGREPGAGSGKPESGGAVRAEAVPREEGRPPGPRPAASPAVDASRPAASPLGGQALTAALRPFHVRARRGPPTETDQEETARGYARALLARTGGAAAVPVLRAPLRRTAVLTVVVDAGASMALHGDTVAAFVSLLRGSGVFHEVRTRYFDSGRAVRPVLRDERGRAVPPAGRRRTPGPHATLVLTDGIGARWHDPGFREWLSGTARAQTTAIVHLLHGHQWPRTGVRTVPAETVAAPAGAGGGCTATALPDAPGLDGDDRVLGPVLPVLPLTADAVHAWAMFATGRSGVLRGPVFPLDPAMAPLGERPPPEEVWDEDPRALVRRFSREVSATTFRLAVALAAVPIHPRAVDRVTRHVLGGRRSGREELAEVLYSGLTEKVGDPGESGDGSAAPFAWDFRDGVRRELLSLGRLSRVRSLVALAAEELEEGDSRFAALGEALRGASPLPEDLFPETMGPVRADPDPWRQVIPALEVISSSMATIRTLRTSDYISTRSDFPLEEIVDRFPETGNTPVRSAAGADAFGGLDSFGRREKEIPIPFDRRSGPSVDGVEMARFDERAAGPPAANARPAGTPGRPSGATWIRVPRRNPAFVGREVLISALRDKVAAGEHQIITALNGMSGVGKTELAKEYLHRHTEEYDLICWISCLHENQIRQAFLDLAEKIGISYVGAGSDHVIHGVLEALRQGQPFKRWLLVFDNAETRESIDRYLPVAGSGHVVITSRNQSWARRGTEAFVQVNVFTRAESVELLRRRGPEGITAEDADRLADALGDLPLALNQAAVWLNEVGMNVQEYLDRLTEKFPDMLRLLEPVDPDYSVPVAAAWNVSLDQLGVDNKAASQLLQLVSFMDTAPIRRDLFRFGRGIDAPAELRAALGDPARLGIAIRDIGRYSLAYIDHQQNTISLHRLVQSAVQASMSDEEKVRMRHCAHQLLAGNDPRSDAPDAMWRYVQLAPHVWTAQAWDCDDPWVRDLVVGLAEAFIGRGEFDETLRLGNAVHPYWSEKLGPAHRDTLRMEYHIAQAVRGNGEFERARAMCAETMRVMGETLGENAPEYLRAEQENARNLRIAGRFQESLALSRDSFERRTRILGEDDPETLSASHFLSFDLLLVGRLRESLESYKATWGRRVAVLGPDHGATRASIDGYSDALLELGDYHEACAMQRHLVERSVDLLGEDHNIVWALRSTLANMIRRTGRLEEAEELSAQTLDRLRLQMGEDRDLTLIAALRHALCLYGVDRYAEALELAESAGERYAKLLGDDHVNVAAARVNQAILLRRLDRPVEARELDEQAMLLFRDKLGPHHPSTLSCAINLANDRFRAGDVEGARAADTEVQEVCREVLGAEHPLTLLARRNRAMAGHVLGETDLEEIDAVQDAYRRVLGGDHPATRSIDQRVRGDADISIAPL
ncbi:Tetratricopeptide repeat-containing protein [Nocardiopsis flavescens]|uniref:Tetratricopeptide repeat-containing protein n=1 Tax=Nocardiopsis flavescens TaxID=758803 RepID=A0A1M6M6G7_9ACTN|nr:FxSxx-COOH system tetratricopeptide repeat protein [Nocardiopsis flavescens]SHJ79056.1 Tetratricopeptide repeat-containing protein [Nocardiopsis flavescens]